MKDKDKIPLVKKCLQENNIDISRIEFCILDLLDDQGWNDALKGCQYVFHMASPVIPGNVDKDLVVKPAVEGMTRCLNAAIKNKAKKFVLTSSYAAIYGNSKNKFSDNDWTDLNRKDLMPYEISKTKSEMGMWEIVKNSEYKIEACSINPVLVLGPSVSGVISMSNKQVLSRILRLPFIPNISVPIVGVKDVANAHLKAMENKNSNGKRFLISLVYTLLQNDLQLIELDFTSFTSQPVQNGNGDGLEIYDGVNTSAPLINMYSGTNSNSGPGFITATNDT